ncbi:hypothetical protein SLE2022_247100 [Rubroshorea leprosula]
MDKLRFAEWSERLKTGGAQVGRIVSGKMKEILQSPTPESKMVDEATSENMEEPNWGMNLRICAMINSEEFSGSEVVKAIKKKFSSKSGVSQRLSLDLLEACTMNCEKVFSEVASEKVLDDMVKMIENPQTDDDNRARALQLIRAWGQSEDLAYLPVFHQTYMSLKGRSKHSPVENESSPPSPQPCSYVHQQSSESYPVPHTGVNGSDHGSFVFNFGSLSIEQKKEFFEITRNSLEVLSSMLNVEMEPKPMQDDLTLSMLEKCKHSQTVIQTIIESTTDDEGILFEALNLHDELQRVITRYEELEAGSKPGGQLTKNSGIVEANATSQVDTPNSSSKVEANCETGKDEPQNTGGTHNASSKDEIYSETETKIGEAPNTDVPESGNHRSSNKEEEQS